MIREGIPYRLTIICIFTIIILGIAPLGSWLSP